MTAPSFLSKADLRAPRAGGKKRRLPTEPGHIAMYISLAFLAAVLIFMAVAGGNDADPAAYDPDNPTEARAQCEDLVEENLKSPATAEFGTSEATRSGTEWIVTGSVDSENSFGAMLRSDFQCSVRVVDGTVERRLDSLG